MIAMTTSNSIKVNAARRRPVRPAQPERMRANSQEKPRSISADNIRPVAPRRKCNLPQRIAAVARLGYLAGGPGCATGERRHAHRDQVVSGLGFRPASAGSEFLVLYGFGGTSRFAYHIAQQPSLSHCCEAR